MNDSKYISLREWVKHSANPLARFFYVLAHCVIYFEIPAPRSLFVLIYKVYVSLLSGLSYLSRLILWTPLFKSQLTSAGKQLYLYGGLPYLAGPLDIKIGDRCRISGKTTITGRSNPTKKAQLILGNNIDIGWMSTIAVGTKIEIQNNVRIAGQCFLAGYPGHPISAEDRALGKPDLESQAADIVLEKDVWLATGVSVMAGVTIGARTIVAAGSVVTHDLPSDVLAAGVPAKVIRKLEN